MPYGSRLGRMLLFLYAPMTQTMVNQIQYALLHFADDVTLLILRNIKYAGDNK